MKSGEIVPGFKRKVSQRMISAYAAVSGDQNPLHVDPEYASKSRFKSTIAHGHIAMSWLCEMLMCWKGPGFLKGGRVFDVSFRAPIRPGEVVEVKGVVTEINETGAICEVWVENQSGDRCVEGKAFIPLSAESE